MARREGPGLGGLRLVRNPGARDGHAAARGGPRSPPIGSQLRLGGPLRDLGPTRSRGGEGEDRSRLGPTEGVLGHVAVGGFVSHCGWNSVLESLSVGVPILAWPMIAEQRLNAKHVVELLGAGVQVGVEAGEIVGRQEVAKGVKEVMGGGEKGWKARERAAELRRAAAAAMAEGGTSDRALEELLEELRRANSSVIREFCKEEEQAVVVGEPAISMPSCSRMGCQSHDGDC